ncbi:MAG: penicillin-binding protein, partial [Pseudomonadota bacterium]
ARALGRVLGLDRRHLAEKFKNNETFIWVKRQVSPDEARRVAELNLTGVESLKESKRFYPNKLLAAHLLGFVGIDNLGLEGLEVGYNEYLKGGIDRYRIKRDALGRTYLDPESGLPEKSKGANIHLTLDRRLQYVTEKALAKAAEKHQAKAGVALIVRPQTGEILALAVWPGFNPNVFGSYNASQRRNRVLTDAFEPGSTFKVFLVAAALEEGLIKPTQQFYCENGAYRVGKHIVHDHASYNWLTVSNVVKYSSNIGAVKISEKLGKEKLHYYLSRFSFGRELGIDFPIESPGFLRPYKRWYEIDAANMAFGQSVSVTALQMTMAMAALANDGLLLRPFLVDRITDASGNLIKKTTPTVIRRVVSPQTARELQAMLRLVVTEGGTGSRAEPKGYPAAGKTGTAQKLDRQTGTYSNKKFFSSFIGFVPYNDPRLVIFVGLDEPADEIYGGTVAAPAFKEIAEEALPLLNVPPVQSAPADSAVLAAANPGPQPSNKIRVKINRGVNAAADGLKAAAAAKEPGPKDKAMEAEPKVEIRDGYMPDLAGLSMRGVLDMMSRYGVYVNFIGSGLAVWQSPSPGEPLRSGQMCQVKFEQR